MTVSAQIRELPNGIKSHLHRVFFSHKIVSTGAYDLLHRVFRTPGFAYTPQNCREAPMLFFSCG